MGLPRRKTFAGHVPPSASKRSLRGFGTGLHAWLGRGLFSAGQKSARRTQAASGSSILGPTIEPASLNGPPDKPERGKTATSPARRKALRGWASRTGRTAERQQTDGAEGVDLPGRQELMARAGCLPCPAGGRQAAIGATASGGRSRSTGCAGRSTAGRAQAGAHKRSSGPTNTAAAELGRDRAKPASRGRTARGRMDIACTTGPENRASSPLCPE